MRRCALVAASAALLAGMAFAIDVAEDEFRGTAAVEFINYEGPREQQFDAEAVRDIGRGLAAEILRGSAASRYGRKYSALHLFDPAMPQRLGADIVTLEPAAMADHINTVRYILAGFLETAYRYSAADARLLAVFVTYYNAVHRGDIPYFSGVYQPRVLENLTAATAGLARRYSEWAGASRILIPLTEKAGSRGPGALDTSALTDKRVVEELRKREDRGVEERKDMVALKEREAAAAGQETADKRAALEREKAAAAAGQKSLDEQKKAASEADRTATRTEAEIARARDEQAAQQKAIDEKKAEAARKEAEVAREEAKAQAKKEEIAQDKAEVKRDERIAEARKDPEKIVSELESKEAELARMGQPIAKNRLYYLKVKTYLSDGHYANELYAIDALSGELLYKAPEKPHIAGHQYTVLAEGPNKGVLVLTHQDDGRESHYLTLLDLDTLKPTRMGSNAIFHKSFVEKRGDFFYAIDFRGDGDFRLGKYDTELKQVAESAERIDPDTVFHIYGDLVFVNSPSKKVLVLKAADLSKVRELDLQ